MLPCICSYLTHSLVSNLSDLLNICFTQTLPSATSRHTCTSAPVPPVYGHMKGFTPSRGDLSGLLQKFCISGFRRETELLAETLLCVWSGCVGVFAVLRLVHCQWPYFEPAAAGAWAQPKIDGKPGQRSPLPLHSATRPLLYLFFSSSLPSSLPFPTSLGKIY